MSEVYEAVRQIVLHCSIQYSDRIRQKNCICNLTFNVLYLTAKSVWARSSIISHHNQHKLLKTNILRSNLPFCQWFNNSAALLEIKRFRQWTDLFGFNSFKLLHAALRWSRFLYFPLSVYSIGYQRCWTLLYLFQGWIQSSRVIPLWSKVLWYWV